MLEFPPLPPSPVEEADEECSDVGAGSNGTGCGVSSTTTSACVGGVVGGNGSLVLVPGNGNKPKVPGHANRTMEYRPRVPPHRGISLDSSKDHHTASLNTRSMDAGYARGRRHAAAIANARREVSVLFF